MDGLDHPMIVLLRVGKILMKIACVHMMCSDTDCPLHCTEGLILNLNDKMNDA